MISDKLISYGAPIIVGLCLLLGSVANAAPTGKIDICHKPGARNQRILNINPEKDGPKHFGHGDYEVQPEVCDGQDSDCDNPINPDNGVDCSDGIACTVDTCAGLPGCFNTPDDNLCDDQDPTTLDECSVASGGCVNTPIQVCGNGTVEAPEQCDDGNTVGGDGCSAICEIEIECPCTGGEFAQARLTWEGIIGGAWSPSLVTFNDVANCDDSYFTNPSFQATSLTFSNAASSASGIGCYILVREDLRETGGGIELVINTFRPYDQNAIQESQLACQAPIIAACVP